MNASDYIAAYAALLSSILAFNEFYFKRLRIDTSYFFTGEEGAPDRITVFNQSDKSIVITHFEVYNAKSKKSKVKKALETGREGEYINISIGPYSSKDLKFYEPNKIYQSPGKSLFIKLYIMGRKNPITNLVCK
jgi:hypothetical protein